MGSISFHSLRPDVNLSAGTIALDKLTLTTLYTEIEIHACLSPTCAHLLFKPLKTLFLTSESLLNIETSFTPKDYFKERGHYV